MSEELPPLLTTDRIRYVKKIDSKKRIFETLAELLASGQKDVTRNEIFDALITREKLGNTIIGNGIAIPRAKINIIRPRAAVVYLKKGMFLDSPDKKATRLFLAILIPERDAEKYTDTLKELNIKLTSKSLVDEFSENKNPQLLVDQINNLINTEQELSEAS